MSHKLLLADDSVTIQRVIELTFADEDIQVIAVGDGKQAIERIQAERPDIVLADIGMPERDGYEVAAFVKGNPELARVPVLLLTGAFEPIDEGRARAAGCDGVLVKPFEPQMVINRVKDLLAGRRPSGLWAATTLSQPSQPAKPPPPSPAPNPNLRAGAPPAAAKNSGSIEEYFDRLDAAFGDLDSSPAANAQASATPPARASRADAKSADPHSDPLADWDPDLAGDPVRPSPGDEGPVDETQQRRIASPHQGPRPEAQAQQPPQPAPAAVSDAPAPVLPRGATLADAFAALLSAEQGRTIAPASVRPEDIPPDTIDDIVRRVIDRVGSATVQDAVQRTVRDSVGETVRQVVGETVRTTVNDAVRETVRDTVLEVAERMVREEIERIKRGG